MQSGRQRLFFERGFSMPVDMKQIIAQAAFTLMIDKKKKKITVKDIVEECHITRQTFYYHFEDIPHLMQYVLEQGIERMRAEAPDTASVEEGLRYIFGVALNVREYLDQAMQTNYRAELERLLRQQFDKMVKNVAQERGPYPDLNVWEQEFVIRFYTLALMGMLLDWKEEDTKNMDQIISLLGRLLTGQIVPLSANPAEMI